jgi:N-acetylglucosaminyldiphosphoundecaprenol N-acetyl-beta-D-mannosaminyltransferase
MVNIIIRTIQARGKARVVYVNISAVNLAQDLAWFRDFINRSDIAYCDGFGVKWGARLLGLQTPYRFTPPDWIALLAEECARQHFSLYLLGAQPSVAEKVAVTLKKQFTDLTIAGTHHGYFDKTPGAGENKAVLEAINAAKPDILLVGFGMPIQERWLMENWDRLEVNVALPVGALFDYLAGEIPRAPHWMTDHGLEWLGRLIVEPRRLWRRYLIGNTRFLWLVLKERCKRLSVK